MSEEEHSAALRGRGGLIAKRSLIGWPGRKGTWGIKIGEPFGRRFETHDNSWPNLFARPVRAASGELPTSSSFEP